MRQRGIESFFTSASAAGAGAGSASGAGMGAMPAAAAAVAGAASASVRKKASLPSASASASAIKRRRLDGSDEPYGDCVSAKGKDGPSTATIASRDQRNRARASRASAMQKLSEAAAERLRTAVVGPVEVDGDATSPRCLSSLLVEPSWREALKPEFEKPYFTSLSRFVLSELFPTTAQQAPVSTSSSRAPPVYPPPANVFRALHACPLQDIKVVIIGQDPYHQRGQAMGLCFSVHRGQRVPPSLLNIYKELRDDKDAFRGPAAPSGGAEAGTGGSGGFVMPTHGDLSSWASQGVLLLNTVLTVRDSQANSHKGKGWERLTDACIRTISREREGVVFLLWGKQAQDKHTMIDSKKHHVLRSVHPSPLSAHRGFLGCRHFSQTNAILRESGREEVDWRVPP